MEGWGRRAGAARGGRGAICVMPLRKLVGGGSHLGGGDGVFGG